MTMLFGGGGPGGALADPLAGMALPPGQPGTLYANAATYSAIGGMLQASSARQSQAMSAVGPAWLGDGSISCQAAVGHLTDSGRKLGTAAEAAVTALKNCGAGWEAAIAKWQQAQALAAQAVADETAQRNKVNQMAAAGNPIGVIDKGLNDFGLGYQSPARAQAVAMGRQAIDLFNQATQRAGAALQAAGLTPPPPKPAQHHGGSGLLQGVIIGGLALADVGLTVANVMQLGLDPVTDGAEVADTTALVADVSATAGTDALSADAVGLSDAEASGMLRDAAAGKGNFGVGTATSSEADGLGRAWVGNNYRVASDGKTLISENGLRQYRPPSYKPNLGSTQANLEGRWEPSGQWQTNGHVDIVNP